METDWCPGGPSRENAKLTHTGPYKRRAPHNRPEQKTIRCPLCNRRLRQRVVLGVDGWYVGIPFHKPRVKRGKRGKRVTSRKAADIIRPGTQRRPGRRK